MSNFQVFKYWTSLSKKTWTWIENLTGQDSVIVPLVSFFIFSTKGVKTTKNKGTNIRKVMSVILIHDSTSGHTLVKKLFTLLGCQVQPPSTQTR